MSKCCFFVVNFKGFTGGDSVLYDLAFLSKPLKEKVKKRFSRGVGRVFIFRSESKEGEHIEHESPRSGT